MPTPVPSGLPGVAPDPTSPVNIALPSLPVLAAPLKIGGEIETEQVQPGLSQPERYSRTDPLRTQHNEKKGITDHANPEGNGPEHSKERGRRGSTGPPQPEQQRQKHHRKCPS